MSRLAARIEENRRADEEARAARVSRALTGGADPEPVDHDDLPAVKAEAARLAAETEATVAASKAKRGEQARPWSEIFASIAGEVYPARAAARARNP